MRLTVIAAILSVMIVPHVSGNTVDIAHLKVTNLWDEPRTIAEICGGQTLIIYICRPDLTTCREGAVFIDSQQARIASAGARPVCIFLGDPETVRELALRLDLKVEIYVDSDEVFYEEVLDQRILPAIVAVDGSGRRFAIRYGGGESLAANLDSLLDELPHRRNWYRIAIVGIVIVAAILWFR